jgi:hypothetical protein
MIKGHERVSFTDFRNSCRTFLKAMPARMNGIGDQYKIVRMLDRRTEMNPVFSSASNSIAAFDSSNTE